MSSSKYIANPINHRKHGQYINITNALSETPLHHACSKNNVFAVEELQKYYVDRNARDARQQTPLIVAACNNSTEAAKLLFSDNNFFNINKTTEGTGKESCSNETIDIRSAVFLDVADELGNTALHYCSIFNNVDLAVFLINKGAKTSILNGEWDTPITILARHQTETTPTIYKEVYEPLLRMQHRVSGSEFDDLFLDQDPIQIEDDVLP
jgi:ankyrin repeat protein